MARHIPIVRNGTLVEDSEKVEDLVTLDAIAVESPDWYAWLERHRSFRFECPAGSFTARKERRSGSWYWYAYRHQAGRLRSAYLGRSTELSATRLQVIAAELAGVDDSSTLRKTGGEDVPGSPAPSSHEQDNTTAPDSLRLHNLGQLTSLVGREQEVASAGALLRRPEVRLLTMVGTAGVGKTRLALQVAFDLVDDFPEGVFFVALAPIRDPELVVSTVAQTLGLRAMGGPSFLNQLKTYLRDRRCLLILDNFEQVVNAAPQLPELLRACPDVKMLVTSREVLHLRAEHQFSVPPLALPDRKQLADAEALAHVAAVELFMQRSQSISPDFHLMPDNAAAIAEICLRLDGLPLAIELAAARIKVLPPQALLARLDHRLQVLTGGARDLPERQRTLRGTIAWSYELLPVDEQRLFRRLSVFVGGCTLEAVEAVSSMVSDSGVNVLEEVASFVDRSLLQQIAHEGEEPRFAMLETIREYGLEALTAHGEIENIQLAHAYYYLNLVEEAEPHFGGPEEFLWLERLARELDNLRAAQKCLLERGEGEKVLRLSGALWRFWETRNRYTELRVNLTYSATMIKSKWQSRETRHHFSEDRAFLERALVESEGEATGTRAKALVPAAFFAYWEADLDLAQERGKESLALYRQLGDQPGMASALELLGTVAWVRNDFAPVRALLEESAALYTKSGDRQRALRSLRVLAIMMSLQGDYSSARVLFEEIVAANRKLGSKRDLAHALLRLIWVLILQGDVMAARPILEECLALFEQVEDRQGVAIGLEYSSHLAFYEGYLDTARSLIEKSLALYREMGDTGNALEALPYLARITAFQGDLAAAGSLHRESLATAREIHDQRISAFALEGLAGVVAARGEFCRAARLWGAAEALRDAMGTPLPLVDRPIYERSVAAARASLGEKAFAAAWAEGRTMTPEQALAAPGAVKTPTTAPAGLSPILQTRKALTHSDGLTPRELEVLRLLAQGFTSTQIANQLIIGLVTVNSHVRSIYSKLGVTSRSAATRFAIEHHLV